MRRFRSAGSTSVKTVQTNGEVGKNHVNSWEENALDDRQLLLNEKMELHVGLPDGREKIMSVPASLPMLDLLVQIASSQKINPAGYIIHAPDPVRGGESILYKPSTPIGRLGTNKIYIVHRNQNHGSTGNGNVSNRSSSSAPFEVTTRVQINLPQSQLMVLRINPHIQLYDVFTMICTERNFNQNHFRLQHPRTNEDLDLSQSLADYELNELTVVSTVKGASEMQASQAFPRTDGPPVGPPLGYKEEKKQHRKSALFGFMHKKKPAKITVAEHVQHQPLQNSVHKPLSPPPGGIAVLPKEVERPPLVKVNQPMINQPVNNKQNVKHGKKRMAPKPPETTSSSDLQQKKTEHSRQSSASSTSSGYHELSTSPVSASHSPDSVISSNRDSSCESEEGTERMAVLQKRGNSESALIRQQNRKSKAPAPPPPPSGLTSHSDQQEHHLVQNQKNNEDHIARLDMLIGKSTVQGRKKRKAPQPPSNRNTIHCTSDITSLTNAVPDRARRPLSLAAYSTVDMEATCNLPSPSSCTSSMTIDLPSECHSPQTSPINRTEDAVTNMVDSFTKSPGDGTGTNRVNAHLYGTIADDLHKEEILSTSSVDTADEIDLSFEDTIAAGEEAIKEDAAETAEQMHEFVEKIETMTSAIKEDIGSSDGDLNRVEQVENNLQKSGKEESYVASADLQQTASNEELVVKDRQKRISGAELVVAEDRDEEQKEEMEQQENVHSTLSVSSSMQIMSTAKAEADFENKPQDVDVTGKKNRSKVSNMVFPSEKRREKHDDVRSQIKEAFKELVKENEKEPGDITNGSDYHKHFSSQSIASNKSKSSSSSTSTLNENVEKWNMQQNRTEEKDVVSVVGKNTISLSLAAQMHENTLENGISPKENDQNAEPLFYHDVSASESSGSFKSESQIYLPDFKKPYPLNSNSTVTPDSAAPKLQYNTYETPAARLGQSNVIYQSSPADLEKIGRLIRNDSEQKTSTPIAKPKIENNDAHGGGNKPPPFRTVLTFGMNNDKQGIPEKEVNDVSTYEDHDRSQSILEASKHMLDITHEEVKEPETFYFTGEDLWSGELGTSERKRIFSDDVFEKGPGESAVKVQPYYDPLHPTVYPSARAQMKSIGQKKMEAKNVPDIPGQSSSFKTNGSSKDMPLLDMISASKKYNANGTTNIYRMQTSSSTTTEQLPIISPSGAKITKKITTVTVEGGAKHEPIKERSSDMFDGQAKYSEDTHNILPASSESVMKPLMVDVTDGTVKDENVVEQTMLLQAQYEQMHEKFAAFQQQMEANQKLLEQTNSLPSEQLHLLQELQSQMSRNQQLLQQQLLLNPPVDQQSPVTESGATALMSQNQSLLQPQSMYKNPNSASRPVDVESSRRALRMQQQPLSMPKSQLNSVSNTSSFSNAVSKPGMGASAVPQRRAAPTVVSIKAEVPRVSPSRSLSVPVPPPPPSVESQVVSARAALRPASSRPMPQQKPASESSMNPREELLMQIKTHAGFQGLKRVSHNRDKAPAPAPVSSRDELLQSIKEFGRRPALKKIPVGK